MNIFILDHDKTEAAKAHVNSHIVKMPLEAAQVLCTNLVKRGVDSPYKPSHQKHPCTLWAGETRSNFLWLCDFALELCKEYTFRYGKVHKSQGVIEYAKTQADAIPDGELTPFAQAMPEQYRGSCAVAAYREYYRREKQHLAKWKTREMPAWY